MGLKLFSANLVRRFGHANTNKSQCSNDKISIAKINLSLSNDKISIAKSNFSLSNDKISIANLQRAVDVL